LQFNCSSGHPFEVDISGTSDLASDIDLPEVLWQDKFTEVCWISFFNYMWILLKPSMHATILSSYVIVRGEHLSYFPIVIL